MLTDTTLKPEEKIPGPGTVRDANTRGMVGQVGRHEKQTLLHIPLAIMTALQEAAARLGGLDIDVVITAAIWAFCRQDPTTRHLIVSEFWFRDLPELESAAAVRHTKSFKERLHALVAYCYPVFRRRTAH